MKKLVALFICVSLVLVPCFAYAYTASGSALTIDEQLWIMNEGGIKPIQVAAVEASALGDSTKATGDTSVFLNGFSYTGTPQLYYLNSSSTVSTGSYPGGFATLPGLFGGITYSIAYSAQTLATTLNNISGYVDGLEGYVDGIESTLTTISSRISTTNTRLSTISSDLQNQNTSVSGILTSVDSVELYLDYILDAIQNQSFTIPQILLDNVQDIHDYQVTSSHFDSILDWYGISSGGTYTLPRYRQVANGGSTSDLTPVTDARNPISNIWYMANNINTSMVYGLRDLLSGISVNSTQSFKDYNLQDVSLGRQSLWYDVRLLGINLNNSLSRLAFVLANDDEIAARQAAAANTAAAVSNVISSSGSGSASPSDISGVAGLKSSAEDSISSGVSASTIFSQTGSGGHAWDWFSQTVADELSAPSRRSDVRSGVKSSGSDTPMLDAYRHDLEEAIGFKLSW